MKIPSRVKIGWKRYKVIRGKHESMLISGGDLLYGCIDPTRGEIHLNDDYSTQQQKATLLHEMVHGISDMYGLGFDEPTVEVFSDALFTVMCDNPEMFG